MALKNAYDYKLVDDEAGLENAIPELKRYTPLAVDCEGVSLSRKGALTIITVATEEKAYIFDVLKLGRAVFSSGLGEILEDKSRKKLMFDCREDSDALWHQFNVKLTGVLDLQLLEIIYRPQNATVYRPSSSKHVRRSQRTDEVVSIFGFARCLELYVKDGDLIQMKNKGKQAFQRAGMETWKKRPLSEELKQYCIVDTMGMFRLYEKMKDVERREEARLRVASERYVDYYRGRTYRSYDTYEMNALLPLDIIPDEGTLAFPHADKECARCHRRFPREEFGANQLRNVEQKCRVCKEIKRRADKKQNKQDQWERRAHRYSTDEDDFMYYGDEDDFMCYGDEEDFLYSW